MVNLPEGRIVRQSLAVSLIVTKAWSTGLRQILDSLRLPAAAPVGSSIESIQSHFTEGLRTVRDRDEDEVFNPSAGMSSVQLLTGLDPVNQLLVNIHGHWRRLGDTHTGGSVLSRINGRSVDPKGVRLKFLVRS